MFSSRNPDGLRALLDEAPGARVGTPADAARFGEVALLAVPMHALPALGAELGRDLAGKVVLEASNPYPARDGALAEEVRASGRGTGIAVARWFPGAHLVRAFNSVWSQTLADEANRAAPRVGIPLASDDAHALQVAAGLVRDAGFDPVVVGDLASAARFDAGTPVYNTGMSGPALRAALDVEHGSVPAR